MNHKRVERIYAEEGLQVKKRKKRRQTAALRVTIPTPTQPNKRWSMDFVADALSDGRRFRCLTIVDDFSRESISYTTLRSYNVRQEPLAKNPLLNLNYRE